MNEAAKAMVRVWLILHGNDVESLARWMRDNLRIRGGIRVCRNLIKEATS